MTVERAPDEYLPYTLPCAWCARRTWWRTADTSKPICLGCAMRHNRNAYNTVPVEVRRAYARRTKELE
jgi:hypothetical protein